MIVGIPSHDYPILNSWAHRKETLRFSAPALTFHCAFWHHDDAPDTVVSEDESKRIRRYIDHKIIALFKRLHHVDGVKDVRIITYGGKTDRIILFESMYEISTDPIQVNQADARNLSKDQKRVIDSVYKTIYLTCLWNGFRLVFSFEMLTEYWRFSVVASATAEAEAGLPRLYHDRLKALLTRAAPSLRRDQKLELEVEAQQIRQYFFNNFWEEVALKLLPTSYQSLPRKFADFRGIVMSQVTYPFPVDALQYPHESRSLSWGRPAADRLMYLINDKAEDHECTASYMLDGRALYMTTLAPQAKVDDTSEVVPVKYLLYVRQNVEDLTNEAFAVNNWQLGRLVSRIHLLGTVRLAALRKLDDLVRSSKILGELEPKIKNARRLITEEFQASKAADLIQQANQKFNEINKLDISILYRIERSRYYVLQFAQSIEPLRIRRVEGYQQYDQFVVRKAGSNFDFIDRLGKRYERATQNLSLLDQYYLSLNANKIAKVGELVLFLVLAPYYATTLLVHVRGEDYSAYGILLLIGFGVYGVWRYYECTAEVKSLGSKIASVWRRVEAKEERRGRRAGRIRKKFLSSIEPVRGLVLTSVITVGILSRLFVVGLLPRIPKCATSSPMTLMRAIAEGEKGGIKICQDDEWTIRIIINERGIAISKMK